ncbi:hypothetical protein HDU77_004564 [Chytriomyces hyalinus]|nr:hypothetical protein HDU77_004564 [Chytriomyces hyalinus]
MNRSTSQSRVKGARATSASRSTSIKTMDARPPQMTSVANNDPTASTNSAGSAGKKIRSSIDLELQLGFEKNPLDKPSSDFRDADQWFSRAKESAETAAAEEISKPSKAQQRISAGFGLWRNRASNYSNIEGQQQQQQQVQGNEEAYTRPKNENRASFFRGSFFGGVPRDMRGGSDNIPLPASSKRPMGPRSLDIGSQVQMASVGKTTLPRNYATQQGDETLDPSASLSVTVWYFQLRVWVFLVILFASALGAAIVGGLSTNILAPPRLTSNFFIFTACFTLLVALVTLLLFILRGSTMMYHYDAPFLLLFSSSSSNNNQLDHSLTKRDAITVWVDIGLHALLLLFWVATLADLGVKIGGCRTGALVLRIDSSACTGFEAGLGLGVVVLIAEVFVLGMKAWELYGNLALIRKAI